MISTIDKAKELVEKFKNVGCASFDAAENNSAIQSALIAVDEIISTLNHDIRDLDVRGNILINLIEYWRDVKKEIIEL